ncbi:cytosolic protein [Candidatus Dependentiae bacterium]|nr:cytosolic protein [Candidatus Dependentiae bacterium]
MVSCSKEKNLRNCNCSYNSCLKKGACCDCLQYHLSMRELPACCFPDSIESTYDRSFLRFIKTYAKDYGISI